MEGLLQTDNNESDPLSIYGVLLSLPLLLKSGRSCHHLPCGDAEAQGQGVTGPGHMAWK